MGDRAAEDFFGALGELARELRETRAELARLRESFEKVIAFGPTPADAGAGVSRTPGRSIANGIADIAEAIASIQRKKGK